MTDWPWYVWVIAYEFVAWTLTGVLVGVDISKGRKTEVPDDVIAYFMVGQIWVMLIPVGIGGNVALIIAAIRKKRRKDT